MKKYFLGLLFALSSFFAAGQNNSAKSTINSNIANQGLRGITDAKLISTLNAIVDWAGSPASKRLTLTQARALTTDYPAIIYITSGTAGLFTLDETDNTTADDGVNTIVTTANNKRYKRVSGSIASITGLQTALDTKANTANARFTGQVGVNVSSPSYDVDVAGGLRAAAGGVMGSGTMNPNAILDLQSTTKVFYPPRMTQAQRLAIASGSPGAGSLVYQSDGTPGLYAFDTSWKRLFTASDAVLASQISAGGAGNVLLGGTTNSWGKVGNTQVDFIWADKIGPGSGFNVVSNSEFATLDGINTTKTIQTQFYERINKDSLRLNFTSGLLSLQGATYGGSSGIINLNGWGDGRYLQTTTANSNYAKYASINRFRSSNIFYPAIALKDSSGTSSYGTYTLGTYDGGGSDRSFGIGFQGTSLFQPNIFTIHNGNVGILTDNPTTRFHVNSKSFFGTGSNPLTAPESFMQLAPRSTNTSNVNSNTLSLFGHVNQSGSGGHTELYISPYYQTTGSNPRYLIDAGTNSAAGGGGTHTRLFSVGHNGSTYIGANLVVDGVDPIYADAGIRVRGLTGKFLAQSIPDVQSRYSAYEWKINGTANNDYNASFMLQHIHKYDMFASANTYTPLRIYQNKVTIGANILPTEVLNVAGNASIDGNTIATGNLNIGENSDATAKVVSIGNGRSANGTVGINFISDTGGNSGLSIQRQGSAGVNSRTDIIHRGTGDFNIHAYEAAKIDFATAGISRLSISSTGNVSLRGAASNGELQFPQTTTNKKLVLFENVAGNDHEFYGLGINTSILRYQASNVNASHVFYAATSSTTSNELFRINNSGVTMKGVQTFVAGDGSMSNTIEGGYNMNSGGARTLLINNSSSIGTEGTLFRNSNTNTNIMAVLNRGNVGIGTTLPHISTILDLNSTTAGLGLPRMTTTQINAIATPQIGLTVYNTTLSKLCYYNGTAWKQVTDANM